MSAVTVRNGIAVRINEYEIKRYGIPAGRILKLWEKNLYIDLILEYALTETYDEKVYYIWDQPGRGRDDQWVMTIESKTILFERQGRRDISQWEFSKTEEGYSALFCDIYLDQTIGPVEWEDFLVTPDSVSVLDAILASKNK